MPRLCRCARGQGWVEPDSRMFFCYGEVPQFEGMRTWPPLTHVSLAGSLLLPSSLTSSLFYFSSIFPFFTLPLFSFFFFSLFFTLSFFFFLFFFFLERLIQHQPWYGWILLWGTYQSPTLGPLSLMTQNKVTVLVPSSDCAPLQKYQCVNEALMFSGIICPLFFLILTCNGYG